MQNFSINPIQPFFSRILHGKSCFRIDWFQDTASIVDNWLEFSKIGYALSKFEQLRIQTVV